MSNPNASTPAARTSQPQFYTVGADGKVQLHLHPGQSRTWESQARFVAMIAGTQSGKALAIDTPIPTPDGFVRMGDLKAGDQVFDETGAPCSVIDATPIMTGRVCYRVTFDDGAAIITDAEHLWRTKTSNERKNAARWKQHHDPGDGWGVRTTEDIRHTLLDQRGANNHAVDLGGAADYPEVALLIPPYTFGAWLGDGTAKGTGFTCADPEIVAEMRGEGIAVGDGRQRTSQGKALTYYLGDMGVLGNKHIPPAYKTASISQRWALLQGLMDTDGYCKPKGHAEFTTINHALALDVLELMRSLGLKPRLKEDRARLYGKDCGPKYRIKVTTFKPLFRLERKRSRQIGGYRPVLFRRYIASVEPVESVPVRCITVDSPNHLYLAGRDYIPTHNTSFGPWWLDREIRNTGGGDHLAVTSSYDLFKLKMLPEILTVFEHVLGIGRYWSGDKLVELRDPLTGKFWAKRSTDKMWGRIILRSANAKGGLESATARSAWLDEAGQDDFVLEAYEAVLRRLALYQGRILLTTTPYNLGWLKQQIYDPWKKGDPSIEVIQFASVTNPVFPMAEFQDRRRKMQSFRFRMFYGGLFDRPAGLIYNDFVDALKHEGGHKVSPFPIPRAWPRYLGVDPGGANLAKVWIAHDTEHDIYYVYRVSLDGNKSSQEHVREVRRLAARHRERIIAVYMGAPSETQQRRDWTAAGLSGVRKPTISDVEGGIDRVVQLFKQYRLYIFDDLAGLLDELATYSRELDPDFHATEKIKNKARYHRLDALRYAVSSLVGRGELLG